MNMDAILPVVEIVRHAKNIVVCAGAGISTSCGLPDFRSKEMGLYNHLDAASIGIPSPELLFDLEYFELDPKAFFKFLPRLLTTIPEGSLSSALSGSGSQTLGINVVATSRPDFGCVQPSPCHYFIKSLYASRQSSSTSQLLRVYTLNIDGLEKRAFTSGAKIETWTGTVAAEVHAVSTEEAAACIVECHGNLTEFTCLKCRSGSSLSELLAPIPHQSSIDEQGASTGPVNKYELGSVFYCNKVIRNPHMASGYGAERRSPRTTAGTDVDGNIADNFNRNLCNGVLKPNILFFGESFNAHCNSQQQLLSTTENNNHVSDESKPAVRKRRRKGLSICQMVKADIAGPTVCSDKAGGTDRLCDCIIIIGMSFKVVSCIHDILRLNTQRRRGVCRAPVVYINNQLPSTETMRQLNKLMKKGNSDDKSTVKKNKLNKHLCTTVITFSPELERESISKSADPSSAMMPVSVSTSSSEDNIFDYILLGDADYITGLLQKGLLSLPTPVVPLS